MRETQTDKTLSHSQLETERQHETTRSIQRDSKGHTERQLETYRETVRDIQRYS